VAFIDRLWACATCVAICLFAALNGAPLEAQVVGVIQISVTSGVARSPVAWATIEVPGGDRAVTNARGRATLRSLPPGRHTLTAHAFGHLSRSVETIVENGRVGHVEITLAAAPFELDPILVSGRAPAEIDAIVLRPDDADPTTTDLADLLSGVPGVTVVRRGDSGSESSIQLRGASSDQLLVLLDGVPLNSVSSGVADLATIALDALEAVIVLPGSRSARYGPRALGGVVLLESRKGRGTTVNAHMGGGAWGALDGGANASAELAANLSATVGGQWRRSSGGFRYAVPDFRGGGFASRENAQSDQVGGQFSLAHAGKAVRLTMRADASATERGSPGAIAQPSTTGEQAHDRMGGTVVAAVGGNRRGLTARLGLQVQRSEYRDQSPPFGQAYDDRSQVQQSDLSAEGWWRAGRLMFEGGFQARRIRVESTPRVGDPLSYSESGAWTRTSAPIDFGNLGVVEVATGFRLDGHDLVDGAVASPTASVRLTRSSFEIAIRWANGFAPPTVSDLFFQEGVLVRANPDLRPERVRDEWNTSVASTQRAGPATVRAELSAWKADVEDMILWFPDFQFIWSPDNFFVTRRGADASITVDLRSGPARHSVTGRLGHSEVEYADGGLQGQVAYRPRSTASAAIRTDLPRGTLTARIERIGERRSVPGSALNSLPAYALVNAGVAMPFTLGSIDARVEMSLSNLLDRSAALLADYPLPGRGWAIRLRLS
jgi:outer membrane cobalamin receptor